jgi:hypothetical protein
VGRWLPALTVLAAASLVGFLVTRDRDGSESRLDRLLSTLEQDARASGPARLPRGAGFYTRIAYEDLAVRVDGRKGPWAARYRQVIRRWVSRDGSARLLFRGGETNLVGRRDRIRWRADGSPSLNRSRGKAWEVDYGRGRFVGGNLQAQHLTYRDLLSLPLQEHALSRRVDALLPSSGPAQARTKLGALAELIGATPTPPAVRAALYAVLADIQGLKLLGLHRDRYGRKGIAVAVAGAGGMTTVTVDPGSARILGVEETILRRLPYADARPGAVVSAHWYLEARPAATPQDHLLPRACGERGPAFGCWIRSR